MVLIGTLVGTFGTLIGAGGGFLLMPILLILYPRLPPSAVTAISMTTVFFNSSSGSVAYARMKRIDYKTGLIFTLATLPGSVAGTLFTTHLDRNVFNIIFGIFMILFSAMIIIKSKLGDQSAPYDKIGLFRSRKRLTDQFGHKAEFSFNMLTGILISAGVGFISGMLGIGGGIVHVPALVFMGFPTHFATATSHFVLALSSLTSLGTHIFEGSLNEYFLMALCIASGALVGAQIGARLSNKLKGSVIMICLAAALALVGVRILYTSIVVFF
ncbi:MAG: hypothetical protein BGN88_05615 [Clostridiales bacterium 43-6]|nr:MAG: hypothetical protein BGN88_05615 [Clostridiales bacterium 43-6]